MRVILTTEESTQGLWRIFRAGVFLYDELRFAPATRMAYGLARIEHASPVTRHRWRWSVPTSPSHWRSTPSHGFPDISRRSRKATAGRVVPTRGISKGSTGVGSTKLHAISSADPSSSFCAKTASGLVKNRCARLVKAC